MARTHVRGYGVLESAPKTRDCHLVAFSLLELLAVLLVVGIMVGFLIPRFIEGRRKAQRIHCIGNLKIIGLSFRTWSDDHTNHYPMSLSTNLAGTKEFTAAGEVFRHFQVMSNELNVPSVLACASDRRRWPAKDWASLSNTNVSYFVGLDADETLPQMPLSGDRNLLGGTRTVNGFLLVWTNDPIRWSKEIHSDCGNVGLADGSVLYLTSARLREALANTGVATNRLAIP